MQPIRDFKPEQFGLSRRQMLQNMGAGFGSVALADMLAPSANACLLYTSPSPRDATLSRIAAGGC